MIPYVGMITTQKVKGHKKLVVGSPSRLLKKLLLLELLP
jgi:hypothetical protein